MDDKPQDSPWDKLLDEVGAQPDQSAFERHQPESQDIPPTIDWDEAERMAEEPKASPTDWNSLAGSLGLEVEEPAPPEPAKKQTAAEAESADAPKIPEETLSNLEMPDQAAFLDEVDATVDDEDETDADAGESAESAADDVGDELPPLPSQMDQAMSETAWEEGEAQEQQAPTADDESDDDGEGISGEAARSAFDALFADGASSWGSAFLSKPKPEESIAGSKEESVAGSKRDLPEDFFDAELSNRSEAKTGDGESGDGESDEEGERPKRKRSRRRRRGGKGRKPTGEGASSEESAGEGAERNELDDETKSKPKRRRSGQRERADDDDLDDEFGEEDVSSNGDDAPKRRQRHRNIPTWSEAIGMIVDSNLEQRAKSPSKPQSSRSRGGRGGRRRGGGGGKKPDNK